MWSRYVKVIVTNKNDPTRTQTFQFHKIDFEVRSTIGWPADTATISICNLSLDEMKFLQSKTFGDMYIEVQAGYTNVNKVTPPNSVTVSRGDEENRGTAAIANKNTLFSGVITNAVGYKRVPEHVFTMFCISKAYLGATEFKQMRDIPEGATLKEAIISMCSDYGFNTVTEFGITENELKVKLPLGRVFHDTFLIEFKNLLGEYNLNFSITTSEIQIFSDTYGDKDAVKRMAQDREPIKLDANSVIGTPIAGICTFKLDTFLNSNVQPGMILDVSPLLGTELLVNGVTSVTGNIILNTDDSVFKYAMEDKYVIMEVIHHGSTHDLIFQTRINAIIGGNNAMGSNELAWQDMYTASGM